MSYITIWYRSSTGEIEIGDENYNHDWDTQALEEYPENTPRSYIEERVKAIKSLSLDEIISIYY